KSITIPAMTGMSTGSKGKISVIISRHSFHIFDVVCAQLFINTDCNDQHIGGQCKGDDDDGQQHRLRQGIDVGLDTVIQHRYAAPFQSAHCEQHEQHAVAENARTDNYAQKAFRQHEIDRGADENACQNNYENFHQFLSAPSLSDIACSVASKVMISSVVAATVMWSPTSKNTGECIGTSTKL